MSSSSGSGAGSGSTFAPIGYAIDHLSVAFKSNLLPNQEYFLQGSILDDSVEVLLHLLRGLCDNVDYGPESFHDHEMVFTLDCNRVSVAGGGSRMRIAPVTLRLRRALDYKENPYHLRYVGITEIGDRNQPTALRTSIDIATSDTVVEFLTELGYELDFEYVARGYMFRKGRMKATVSKIFKMKLSQPSPGPTGGNGNKSSSSSTSSSCSSSSPSSASATSASATSASASTSAANGNKDAGTTTFEPLTNSYIVELSIVAPGGNLALAEEVRLFAEQLKPLVHMEKIDYNRPLFQYLVTPPSTHAAPASRAKP